MTDRAQSGNIAIARAKARKEEIAKENEKNIYLRKEETGKAKERKQKQKQKQKQKRTFISRMRIQMDLEAARAVEALPAARARVPPFLSLGVLTVVRGVVPVVVVIALFTVGRIGVGEVGERRGRCRTCARDWGGGGAVCRRGRGWFVCALGLGLRLGLGLGMGWVRLLLALLLLRGMLLLPLAVVLMVLIAVPASAPIPRMAVSSSLTLPPLRTRPRPTPRTRAQPRSPTRQIPPLQPFRFPLPLLCALCLQLEQHDLVRARVVQHLHVLELHLPALAPLSFSISISICTLCVRV